MSRAARVTNLDCSSVSKCLILFTLIGAKFGLRMFFIDVQIAYSLISYLTQKTPAFEMGNWK